MCSSIACVAQCGLRMLLFYLIFQATPKSDAQLFMIPGGEERTIDVGSHLIITCTYKYPDEHDRLNYRRNISWTFPYYLVRNEEGVVEPSQVRFSATADKNETHLTSTMTLTNVTAYDTGYFSCKAIYRDEIKQYVYVYDRNNAVIKDDPQFRTKQESGEPLLIGCRPTHPNVTVVLLRLTRHIHPKEENNYQWDYSKNLLSGPNPSWTLDSHKGLRKKRATVGDTGYYYCFGAMGEPVGRLDKRIIFVIGVRGVELERLDGTDDPLEGSNVTLVCHTYANLEFSSPPEWIVRNKNTGSLQDIDELSPPKGIEITTENITRPQFTWIYYESRLQLFNISLDTPTTLQCKGKTSKGIVFRTASFAIKVQLEKERPKNLTCSIPSHADRVHGSRMTKSIPVQFTHWVVCQCCLFKGRLAKEVPTLVNGTTSEERLNIAISPSYPFSTSRHLPRAMKKLIVEQVSS
nr:putative vascular endothelial growth factor receptor 3 [Daphnia magna]